MITLSEEVTIPFPADVVWPLLVDPALVASFIPGAGLTAIGDGVVYGALRITLGPTVALLRGEIKLVYDNRTRRCAVEGLGVDAHSRSRAVAQGVVTVSGEDATRLALDGSVEITGSIEAIAHTMCLDTARDLLAEFARELSAFVAARGDPAPDAATIPLVEFEPMAAPAAASVDETSAAAAGISLWHSGVCRLRQLFVRKRPGPSS